MLKMFVWLLVVLSTITSCGIDDLDTDKISFSSVEISPGIMIPVATADVSVEYLFDKQDNAIEYYVEDGYNKIRICANHDSIIAYSMLDKIGMANALTPYMGIVQFPDELSQIDFLSEEVASVSKDLTYVVSLKFPIDSIQATLSAVECSYALTLNWENFSHPITLDVNVAGNSWDEPLTISGSSEFTKDTTAIFSIVDNTIVANLTITTNTTGGGSLGNLWYTFAINNIESVSGRISNLAINSDTYISFAALGEFRRLMDNVDFKDPHLWITATNATDLSGTISPDLGSAEDGNLASFIAEDGLTLPRRQSIEKDIADQRLKDLLADAPDSLAYNALIELSDGGSMATIRKDDSLFVGYHYVVPFTFKYDGEVGQSEDGDTVSVSDLPELANIDEAKLLVTCENSFPMGGSVFVQLLEKDTHRKLSTIVANNILIKPETVNGISDTPKNSGLQEVPLTPQNIEDLQNTDALLLKFFMSSEDEYVTPILENKLKIDIAIVAKLNFNY